MQRVSSWQVGLHRQHLPGQHQVSRERRVHKLHEAADRHMFKHARATHQQKGQQQQQQIFNSFLPYTYMFLVYTL